MKKPRKLSSKNRDPKLRAQVEKLQEQAEQLELRVENLETKIERLSSPEQLYKEPFGTNSSSEGIEHEESKIKPKPFTPRMLKY